MHLVLLLATSALAGDGYWHPNDLMVESKAFARLSEGAMSQFEARTRRSDELAGALVRYELALDLLGDRAPQEERARLEALEKQFNREKAVVEAFASTLIEDVDGAFYGAVERAIGSLGVTAAECEREVPTGPQVPGMRVRTAKNPACVGDDLNARIAAAVDGDGALAKDIDEILALPWPDFTVAAEARPAVGDHTTWIAVYPLFAKGARDALATIDRADETARLPIQSAIEEGADLASLGEKAAAIDAATAVKHAALGAPVLEAAERTLAKWGESVAWCANPAVLGGCEGTDATETLVPRLLDDARVEKSLKKANLAAGG